jgi:hypothetical protein
LGVTKNTLQGYAEYSVSISFVNFCNKIPCHFKEKENVNRYIGEVQDTLAGHTKSTGRMHEELVDQVR